MKESQRLGLVSSVVHMLEQAGSYTARMHIHKTLYFAQQLLGLQPIYEFVLYQRGPYSFDLDADIRSLRSIAAVEISPAPPYGPSYSTTALGKAIMRLNPVQGETTEKLARLANALGPKPARELELLATTLYVTNQGLESDEDIIARVAQLKPRFGKDEAEKAIREVEQIREQFTPSAGD